MSLLLLVLQLLVCCMLAHDCTTGIGSLNENFGVEVDVASAVLKFGIGVGGLKLNCVEHQT